LDNELYSASRARGSVGVSACATMGLDTPQRSIATPKRFRCES